jgi:tetratricopeptide (TPR) repeat protein
MPEFAQIWLSGAGVSEESARVGSGPEGNGAGIDPTAVALALAGASREKADAFLDEERALAASQSALIADQRHHLAEDIKQIDLRIWELRMGVLLRVATLVVGIAVAAGVSLFVWDAAHANGLIVNEFSVAPDIAARGLTGQVLATQLLGDLSDLQSKTNSVRAAFSYTNNWGNDLKVEIPDTGISIGEFTRFLREWIGNETHISGAVYRTATGIVLSASVGSDALPTLTGGDTDIDALLSTMAEAIYQKTQPHRYAIYIYGRRRYDQAEAALKALTVNGQAEDQFWAYNGLISLYDSENRWSDAEKAVQGAFALRQGSVVTNFFSARSDAASQRDEESAAAARILLAGERDPDISERNWNTMRLATECLLARLHGAFLDAINLCRQARQRPDVLSIRAYSLVYEFLDAAAVHDAEAMHAAAASLPSFDDPQAGQALEAYEAWNEVPLGHWSALLQKLADLKILGHNGATYTIVANARAKEPIIAYAMALSGDLAGAHAFIDRTPVDCGLCLRMRGRIDSLEKNWTGADYWFARAVSDAPSVPFAFEDWGQSILTRGLPDAAIEKFKQSNQKGPRFADPLEGWGEALMAKSQSHLALAKFAEAEKYAPNWGRLHLKWGEALYYMGRRDEARAQFARAAALDLTPSEKSELARAPHG